MGQVGVICPVSSERVSNADCRACSRSREPLFESWCNYSPEMIYGMTDGGTSRSTAFHSTTMLNGCMRQTRLGMSEDYHVELDRVFPAFRGQWGHLVTEHSPVPGTIYEIRFELDFQLADGRIIKFTGQGDALDLVRANYRDYKTKSESRFDRRANKRVYKALPTEVGDDYLFQLNAYRLLFYYGSPQRVVDQDAFGDPLPGGVTYYPGVPAQIELESHELFAWSMSECKRYPCAQIDYRAMYDEILRRLEIICAVELPPVPGDLNPATSVFCIDWCPKEIRAACLEELATAIPF